MIASVGLLESGNVFVPQPALYFKCFSRCFLTPRKSLLAVRKEENVRHEARMSAISVCKNMSRDQSMMEANADLIPAVGSVLNPILRVSK